MEANGKKKSCHIAEVKWVADTALFQQTKRTICIILHEISFLPNSLKAIFNVSRELLQMYTETLH